MNGCRNADYAPPCLPCAAVGLRPSRRGAGTPDIGHRGPARDEDLSTRAGQAPAAQQCQHRARYPCAGIPDGKRARPAPADAVFRADHHRPDRRRAPHGGNRSVPAADPAARRGRYRHHSGRHQTSLDHGRVCAAPQAAGCGPAGRLFRGAPDFKLGGLPPRPPHRPGGLDNADHARPCGHLHPLRYRAAGNPGLPARGSGAGPWPAERSV